MALSQKFRFTPNVGSMKTRVGDESLFLVASPVFPPCQRHNLRFINIFTDDGFVANTKTEFDGMKRFHARTAVLQALRDKDLYRGTKDNPMVVPICRYLLFSSAKVTPFLKIDWKDWPLIILKRLLYYFVLLSWFPAPCKYLSRILSVRPSLAKANPVEARHTSCKSLPCHNHHLHCSCVGYFCPSQRFLNICGSRAPRTS